MSDLPGHDHDPDPAALDELRRAFGTDVPPPAPEPVDDATAVADEPDEPDEPDVDPSFRPTVPNPVVEAIGSPELAALGRGEAPSVDHEPTPPGLGDDDAPSPPEPDVEPDPVDDPVDDATPTPTSAPSIIRIDDYSGSTTIDPADATPSARHEPAAEPVAIDEPGDGGIISISVDDDLPDPVYVEGNLDRDGGGTIVFIENDETGDTLAPESERDMRRGIEPRMRERRVAVKRAQGRRRLKRVLLIVGVVVVIVGGLAVLGSPLFAVRESDVEVYGAVYSQGDEFDAVIDDAVGTPVLRVDTNRLEDDLEAIPWIEQAQVTTDFPHGLVIDVRERAAVSTYQGPDGRFRVLDREGRVLDVIDDGYPYAYVLIGGPDAVDLEPGDFAPQGYAAASELAKNLTSSVRGHVVRIEVLADGSRLALELDDGSTVFFGEARDILAKLVRLEAVFANGEDREPGLIDVSTADVTR
ncbi:MAG: FtsQ-type POTRA domain-containing protein [Ilumatobacter sp.]|nr:FtsQ-type POTRA domain-containing protein [Ilumatobacter sp.]